MVVAGRAQLATPLAAGVRTDPQEVEKGSRSKGGGFRPPPLSQDRLAFCRDRQSIYSDFVVGLDFLILRNWSFPRLGLTIANQENLQWGDAALGCHGLQLVNSWGGIRREKQPGRKSLVLPERAISQ